MKLIGKYMSPYTRRVAVSAGRLGIEYEHLDFATATDQEKIREYNPMGRVPVVVLGDGSLMVESGAILEWLDEQVSPERRLMPAGGLERREILQLLAWATGAGDKTVTAYYELTRRPQDKIHEPTVAGNIGQAAAGMDMLNRAAEEADGWLVGDSMTQADITAVVFFEFIGIVLGDRFDSAAHGGLQALARRAEEEEPAFARTSPR